MRSYRTVVDENRRLREDREVREETIADLKHQVAQKEEVVVAMRMTNQQMSAAMDKQMAKFEEAKNGYAQLLRDQQGDHLKEIRQLKLDCRAKVDAMAKECATKMEDAARVSRAEMTLAVKKERIDAEKRVATALTLRQKCMVHTITKRQD